jgi:2-polyprenyl-6-hydroxyphenyl methylase/3-demethylubiquinone-9 3-methyltransferase
MPIDNHLYDRLAASWWDESGPLHTLAALNPVRFGFLRDALAGIGLDPHGSAALDIGCGGGLLAEEFARLGCRVSGIDPSAGSLAAAAAHARAAGLAIDYRQGTGEALPYADGAFDFAYACDVLEHVADLPRVIAEAARVLRPGGAFLFDTINRTLRSWLVVIQLFQEWRATSFLPPDLHDWRMFIRPAELAPLLARNGLALRALTGLRPSVGPLRALRLLRARKRGEITAAEVLRRLGLRTGRGTEITYLGCAVKG